MPPVDALLLFFSTSILLALAPGPDNLFVLVQAAQRGKIAGLAVTLGLCTGLLVHTTAVALGLAAVVKASALAFSLLKYLGAVYLLYLAAEVFWFGSDDGDGPRAVDLPLARLYRRGIIMNVTNPKVSIFFLAFLPQFADPRYGPLAPQIIVLGGLFIVATIIIFGGISLLAGACGDRFRRSERARLVLKWLTGGVFAGLAIKLALTER
ncbi:LysE family translocator [Desulfoprunum benzoelyticum]|uniref:Threonine/homoserine/homoserine lactone efflux protein n=1 Tax=Desulfoprunum benzoelyticum TaxID=1506996 RepID=A0A840V011_9BACT|nr:LysE family translocator [Desulfoprunum benzoelyticum]MBB5348228.1 threonine/homoserine/homoserine lactone efflux protein [Desulfoprunum benzoelyticum]MBM9529580.1 LysE family translocator [Desulfoprunum benzoelyticum]